MARDQEEPLYFISVAARLVEVHPQTLRMYEREGLVRPARVNRLRLYSERDIERVRRVQSYTRIGVNLQGVKMILDLLDKWEQARQELEELRAEMEAELGRAREELG
jgi:MerR family transcriptional regulator/heat shock protein HspR